MEKTISATQARIHFGEVLQQVKNGPVIVERSGEPLAVVLSKHAYDQLIAGVNQSSWLSLLEETHRRIRAERKGEPLPPPEEILDNLRQERNASLDPLR